MKCRICSNEIKKKGKRCDQCGAFDIKTGKASKLPLGLRYAFNTLMLLSVLGVSLILFNEFVLQDKMSSNQDDDGSYESIVSQMTKDELFEENYNLMVTLEANSILEKQGSQSKKTYESQIRVITKLIVVYERLLELDALEEGVLSEEDKAYIDEILPNFRLKIALNNLIEQENKKFSNSGSDGMFIMTSAPVESDSIKHIYYTRENQPEKAGAYDQYISMSTENDTPEVVSIEEGEFTIFGTFSNRQDHFTSTIISSSVENQKFIDLSGFPNDTLNLVFEKAEPITTLSRQHMMSYGDQVKIGFYKYLDQELFVGFLPYDGSDQIYLAADNLNDGDYAIKYHILDDLELVEPPTFQFSIDDGEIVGLEETLPPQYMHAQVEIYTMRNDVKISPEHRSVFEFYKDGELVASAITSNELLVHSLELGVYELVIYPEYGDRDLDGVQVQFEATDTFQMIEYDLTN